MDTGTRVARGVEASRGRRGFLWLALLLAVPGVIINYVRLGLVAGVVAILGTLGGMALLVWVLFALERRRRRRRVQGELATAGATMYLQELRRLQAPSSQDQLA